MTIPAWVNDWTGSQHMKLGRGDAGFDCVGLYIALNKSRLGVDIPDPYCTIRQAITGRVIKDQTPLYSKVNPSDAREGDAILIRQKGFPIHVGYCIDKKWMLHTRPKYGCTVEPWSGLQWVGKIWGIYRHVF